MLWRFSPKVVVVGNAQVDCARVRLAIVAFILTNRVELLKLKTYSK